MTQADIVKLLKKTQKWMTSKEIAEVLKISSCNPLVRKLSARGEILKREHKLSIRGWTTYQYKIK